MKLKSMKLAKREAQPEPTSIAGKDDGPRYPWGLQLELNDEALEKLGMSSLPKVGKTCTVQAKAIVTGVRENQNQSGTNRSVSLQITDLGVSVDGGGKLYDEE